MKVFNGKIFVNLFFTVFIFVVSAASFSISAQNLDRIEKQRLKDMLSAVKAEVKKNYYDPEFHGVDFEKTFEAAKEKIDQATSLGQAQGIIAQYLLNLNDSHTWFIPPQTNVIINYEWQMQMIGDKCFVTSVKPKSDAEAKGLKVGDQILSIEGFPPSRKEMWKIMYYYNALSPRLFLRLSVKSPQSAEIRELTINSNVRKMDRIADLTSSIGFWNYIRESERGSNIDFHRFIKTGSVFVWKPLSFGFDPKDVSEIVERFRQSNTVIFDFRGNPGGYVVTLEKLVGFLFKNDLKIADVKYRNKVEKQQAKTEKDKVFDGKIIVLVDSKSGSAAEIFARLIQLEKRGIVIGDRSAGAVMQSRQHPLTAQGMGGNREFFYGVSITNADVIMSDGKSLEHTGVTPDEFMIPTAEDIAAKRDPVMSYALKISGVNISPEEAGKFFPYQWSN